MAIMRATRMLRDAPFGNSLGVEAKAGAKVRILDEDTSPVWTKIELTESPDPKQVGWVSSHAVDPASDELGPLDRLLFASECAFAANTFRVHAHYIMAIAHMRTNIVDGKHGSSVDHGPFALSPVEWQLFGSLPEFDMNMSEENFKNWTAQCLVFGAMTNVMQRRLAGLLASQPTAAQLAIAQMIGTTAAARVLGAPDVPVLEVLAGVNDSELAAEAIERQRLPARYASYLDGKTGKQALDAVALALQPALDETASFILKVGAPVLEFSGASIFSPSTGTSFISAEILGNGAIRYVADDGSTLIRQGGTISWRRNNPGNIKNGPFAKGQGSLGGGNGFAIFPTEEIGFAAIKALLSGAAYRDLTLTQAMNKYAPPSDNNNTPAYIAFITNTTGIQPSQVLKDLTPEQLSAMAGAIKKQEGWQPGAEITTAPTNPHPQGDVTADAIVRSATHEWEHWGKSTWNTISGAKNVGKTERSDGYANYVYETYYKAVIANPSASGKAKMLRRIAEQESPTYAWSAVAISYMLKNAGYSKTQFKFAEGHSVFIRAAIAAKDADMAAAYWGYRIGDVAPAVGDLIGYARKRDGSVSHDAAQAFYDKTGGYLSHTDIVVAVRPGEIDVIGGNVLDSVTKKTVRTDPVTGLLTDMKHPWFVVLKRRLPN